MFPRPFFEAYGEVLHAVALADGDIQAEELERLLARIEPMLAPLEGSEVYALRSVWYLDSIVLVDGPAAIARFVETCRRHDLSLNQRQASALADVLVETARAYGRVEDAEQALVNQFRADIQAVVRA